MIKISETIYRDDPYNLRRFTKAQRNTYDRALAELRNGKKQTHWMWYIFPQIDGLGHSTTSRRYAIKSIEEARQYLNHPVLGKRLLECVKVILAIEGRSISEIFDHPDDMKLKSSMTLFACLANRSFVFARILEKYFNCERDITTLQLFERIKENEQSKSRVRCSNEWAIASYRIPTLNLRIYALGRKQPFSVDCDC